MGVQFAEDDLLKLGEGVGGKRVGRSRIHRCAGGREGGRKGGSEGGRING